MSDRHELDYAIAALLQALEEYFYPKTIWVEDASRISKVEALYQRVKTETVIYSQKLLQEKK